LFAGRGFVPRVPVRIGTRLVRPSADGFFSALITAHTKCAQELVIVPARQQGQTVRLRFWVGALGINVPSWGDRNRPARGTPRRFAGPWLPVR
jgi:hypothetical protein